MKHITGRNSGLVCTVKEGRAPPSVNYVNYSNLPTEDFQLTGDESQFYTAIIFKIFTCHTVQDDSNKIVCSPCLQEDCLTIDLQIK